MGAMAKDLGFQCSKPTVNHPVKWSRAQLKKFERETGKTAKELEALGMKVLEGSFKLVARKAKVALKLFKKAGMKCKKPGRRLVRRMNTVWVGSLALALPRRRIICFGFCIGAAIGAGVAAATKVAASVGTAFIAKGAIAGAAMKGVAGKVMAVGSKYLG